MPSANPELEAAVREDLQWAIHSPLLCGSYPPLFEEWAEARLGTEALGAELLNQRRVPIGRYFERLIQYWLSTREGLGKLEANLPIRSSTRTLGELDLLFEAQGRAFHWELAVKFYLGTDDRLETRQWFGPQGRDRLDLKLEKIEIHQLPLLETAEGQALLQESAITSIESHALIKGYLFHPFDDWSAGVRPVPPEVNPQHAHGWWIHQSDVHLISARSPHWTILAKQDWLAAARGPATIQASDLQTSLSDHLEAQPSPPMIAALSAQGRELERGFVVPDNWSPSPR